jgi:hypothetical protein
VLHGFISGTGMTATLSLADASTAAVFLDIEKAFDTTWHSGLLYKLSKLEFSNSLIESIGV